MNDDFSVPSDRPDLSRLRRPHGSGDAWVSGPDGQQFWGRFGAAGLLTVDPQGMVLLQHRAQWSHFGGTWGLPGGARHESESAADGAAREANEEAGVPREKLDLLFTSLLDLGWWSYTTVAARAREAFDPVISDAESTALEWVAPADVEKLPLHPGFAESWPILRDAIGIHPHVIVDAANVVGSRPDGWWKDRAGAAAKLGMRIQSALAPGIGAEFLGLPLHAWWPRVSLVVEGQARTLAAEFTSVTIVRAPGEGDDTIVELARLAVEAGERTIVVTSDRELRSRSEQVGADTRSSGAFLRLLGV